MNLPILILKVIKYQTRTGPDGGWWLQKASGLGASCKQKKIEGIYFILASKVKSYFIISAQEVIFCQGLSVC